MLHSFVLSFIFNFKQQKNEKIYNNNHTTLYGYTKNKRPKPNERSVANLYKIR